MREALAKLVQEIGPREAHCYGGLLLVGLGSWMLSPAGALIVVGAALVFLALRRS